MLKLTCAVCVWVVGDGTGQGLSTADVRCGYKYLQNVGGCVGLTMTKKDGWSLSLGAVRTAPPTFL